MKKVIVPIVIVTVLILPKAGLNPKVTPIIPKQITLNINDTSLYNLVGNLIIIKAPKYPIAIITNCLMKK